MRIGVGYDVHAFDPTRPLLLGGVLIEGAPGLAGWSDADVVCHAVADALLGAANMGDLGSHFSADKVPEGVSSLELLGRVATMLAEREYAIANIDTVVAIQEVVMAPYRRPMAERMAEALSIDTDLVSVKATTTDRLGFVGRAEGISAMAVALIE